ncbi:hypothetical protein [Neisseria gonorrhoeae]|uniref:Uncharacterized protein n=1 Tax=Neisseria gonorrhoeae (strain ATCC 700825 / FA 1090) TaxID=242231 RepID=A0A0H4J5W6_NEIG1|nr:hypothetical protein [Neisseria gonorrhoeae]AKO63757.1 hypothetical protein NGO_08685 [Neisseria gonorrhoeae FA 1090]KAE9493454.1 hypothetical protein F9Z35_1395 [Neisseria gonorrhoeae]KAE9494025.1 hypothetical protein F9Z35_1380 [Neisseria gonorrhoeae]KAE9498695.1 hypothetical protein F9Z37_1845 [Neisseria gonorrhoeae]KAE9500319.1 hypothetical protein F9Z38_1078 [Neisseria gonorrhoeae]
MRETCFFCKYADFKTQPDTPVHAFAKCAKARNAEERAKHYPRTNPCAAGAFQTASGAAVAKRTAVLGEYPPPQCAEFEREGG